MIRCVRKTTMKMEHSCWWTSRKESEISDDGACLSGAGICPRAIERAAFLLGSTLTRRAATDDEYGESIAIDKLADGGVHDGCFFWLRPPSLSLKVAVLQSLLELHSSYLGVIVEWSAVVPAILERFHAGMTIRLRSDAKRQCLLIRAYPKGSKLIARLRARPVRVECAGGVGLLR